MDLGLKMTFAGLTFFGAAMATPLAAKADNCGANGCTPIQETPCNSATGCGTNGDVDVDTTTITNVNQEGDVNTLETGDVTQNLETGDVVQSQQTGDVNINQNYQSRKPAANSGPTMLVSPSGDCGTGWSVSGSIVAGTLGFGDTNQDKQCLAANQVPALLSYAANLRLSGDVESAVFYEGIAIEVAATNPEIDTALNRTAEAFANAKGCFRNGASTILQRRAATQGASDAQLRNFNARGGCPSLTNGQ